MNVSNVGSPITGSSVQSAASPTGSARADRDGDNDGGKRVQGGRQGGGQMFDAVVQTLSQLGIGTVAARPAPPATPVQATATNNDGESAAAGKDQNAGQALHSFMHALFQALGQGGGTAPAAQGQAGADSDADNDGNASATGTANGSTGYSDLATRLENLVQPLSGTSASGSANDAGSASDPLSELKKSFENLAQALQGSGATSNAADLQAFLKTLAQNIQNSGAGVLRGSGNVVNTTA